MTDHSIDTPPGIEAMLAVHGAALKTGGYSNTPPMPATMPRRWNDLSEDEQARVKRLLTPDPDDNLDDLLARMERAGQIIRGEKP